MPLTSATRILAVALLGGIALPSRGQQWYYKSYTANGSLAGTRSFSFTIGNLAYVGGGVMTNNAVVSSFSVYDPVTNTFAYRAVFPDMRENAVGFSIGTKGYAGMGRDAQSFFHNDMYTYDPTVDFWSPIAAFPGAVRWGTIAFTIGGKAYVGGGVYGPTNTYYSDLWEYDPVANTWTAKASIPAPPGVRGGCFVIGNKGYVISGSGLFEYDPLTNAWTTKANWPGGPREGPCSFQVNGIGYVGCGHWTTDMQDMYAYDVNSDTWSTAPSLWGYPGRYNATAFSLSNKGYILAGEYGAISPTRFNDLWEFGPVTIPAVASWTQRPFMPTGNHYRPFTFTIGQLGYCGGDEDGANGLWAYDPLAQSWTARAAPPPGSDVGLSISNKGYVTTSAATQNFWEYDPVANTWTVRADLPGGSRNEAAGFTIAGKAYVGGGFNSGNVRLSDLWEYDPGSNTWTQRADIPYLPRCLGSAFSIGNKGYFVGGNTGGTTTASDFTYRFDPVANTWTQMASLPNGGGGGGRQSAFAFSIGNKGYVGGGYSGGPWYRKRFDEYDAVTNTWTQLADLPDYRYGAGGFSIGAKGYFMAGRATTSFGGGDVLYRSDLWEFNPSTISVSVKVLLEGPYVQATGTMTDALRTAALLPLTDPFGTNGYPYPGGTYSDLGNGGIPTTTGNDAIVDRVIVELRDPNTPAQVKASRSVWVQRDGDVVDMDGLSPVRFTMAQGSYYVAIRHRNHLGAMTAVALSFADTPVAVDFTLSGTPTYGTNARKTIGTKQVLWMGDVTFNNAVSYGGAGNDRDPILVRVGGNTPNTSVVGYFPEDTNMDGSVKYTGAANDRDPILTNVGPATPNSVRSGQLP